MGDALAQRVVVSAAGRLDAVLSDALPDLSRSRVAALVKDGKVTIDGAIARKPSVKVAAGDTVVVDVPPPVPMEAVPQDLPVSVVYEDASLVIVDKAAGMVVHPAAGHPDGTLVNALLHHVGDLSGIGGVQRPGIVHRLDKGTSGLMVVAKGDASHQHLSAQFAEHSAGRVYLALCHGVPKTSQGTIRSMLARHSKDRKRWASTDDGSGKEAITHWQRLAVAGTVSLVACRLETGRTHQVRVHLTEQGWPLVGDPVYKRGKGRLPSTLRDLVSSDRPLLHALRLHLEHPESGERLELQALPPADFLAALAAVGIDLDEVLATLAL